MRRFRLFRFFFQNLTAYIDQLPVPEDFVTELLDQSQVSLSFEEPIAKITVRVVDDAIVLDKE